MVSAMGSTQMKMIVESPKQNGIGGAVVMSGSK